MPTHRPARPGSGRADRNHPRPDRGLGDLLYGRNAVQEALRGPRAIRRVLIADGAKLDDRLQELVALAGVRGASVHRRPRQELDDRVGPVNHQGVVAEAGAYPYVDPADLIARFGVIVALDHLQDPQNIGILIRSALAFGAAGVLIPADRAAEITPAVVNASAGAAELLSIARVTNLTRELDRMKEGGRWVIGLDTGDDAVSIAANRLPAPAVLVVGGEGSGMGRLVRERCDVIVSIPISPSIDSLNAATAASIALFELERQRLADA